MLYYRFYRYACCLTLDSHLIAHCESAMYVYDYLASFTSEVQYFWTFKPTGASTLYLAARYLQLLNMGLELLLILDRYNYTNKVCIHVTCSLGEIR